MKTLAWIKALWQKLAKIKVLERIAPFLNNKKIKLLVNAFFKCQFSYCPLSWMFHSYTLNKNINRLHGRRLHMIYNGNTTSFMTFWKKVIQIIEIYRKMPRNYTNLPMVYLQSWSVIVLKQITWLCITLETDPLSIFSQFAHSYLAQNHSPTWDRKFGNLYQVI